MGGQMPAEKDDFFAGKKEKFLQQMQDKGYDLFAVQDFLERHKMVSLDSYIVEQNLQKDHAFINALAQFQPKD